MSLTPKKLVILGATGSIGDNTLAVLRKHKEKFQLVGVACDRSSKKLADICNEFEVPYAAIYDEKVHSTALAKNLFPSTQLEMGMEGLIKLASLDEADIVLVAVVGTLGLKPALAAVEKGKDLALASKEILVMAGKFFTEAVKKAKVKLLPIDSEHNAIFQCLNGESHQSIKNIILTASGGIFRDRPLDTFDSITPEEATRHPNWSMGRKITVDSATMANKGLEIIEAHWLFGTPAENIKVVIHPTSIIHSLVEFIDGSILAQLSPPSMTFAIQHALLYPERFEKTEPSLNFSEAINLDLSPPDMMRYPCLRLAYEALKVGGVGPAIYNAANEISVEAFLKNQIGFIQIPVIIEKTLEITQFREPHSLEEVLEIDLQARQNASQLIKSLSN
ncbi:MAG: 1-deoxy-D-xylulose-5-phosphate reductoisomerase [Verrucomicrobia bacterium]|nr:1-deoxy-D-xylulose-5-phosphate reductoisomerase [Verrucomicrobiota bacterium]MDA1067931.1 1-deoxy-D-xylulose-5-phosphate reductoisomerase [Verrucomicrobiota bacterium]